MPRILPSRAGYIVTQGIVAAALASLCSGPLTAQDGMNKLTAAEKAAGWKLLFDGKSLDAWRGFRSETPGAGWKAVDGALVLQARGGDLMTREQFGDFELRLDWKISKDGNCGIMFRVTTDEEEAYFTGPEMQILDNAGHRDGKDPKRSAGSNYDMHAPVRDVTRPVGEWNEIRLLVKGAHVEHWMNGVKLLEYELWSPEWEKLYQASKFAKMPRYGRATRGHIIIQDHGNLVWFRNLKIRPL